MFFNQKQLLILLCVLYSYLYISLFLYLQTVKSPTKDLFGTQNLFVDEGSSSDNYKDSDNESDYYFSDDSN